MGFGPGKADTQLQLIGDVTELLTARRVPHWLFGGWAVDFAVGHVTREHSDVEIIVWRRDLDAVHGLLAELGFDAHEREEWCVDYRRSADGELLMVSLLAHNDAGQTITPGPFAGWPWPESAFQGPPGQLGDVAVPMITADEQARVKEFYFGAATGDPPRRKDVEDIAVLKAFLGGRSHTG